MQSRSSGGEGHAAFCVGICVFCYKCLRCGLLSECGENRAIDNGYVASRSGSASTLFLLFAPIDRGGRNMVGYSLSRAGNNYDDSDVYAVQENMAYQVTK